MRSVNSLFLLYFIGVALAPAISDLDAQSRLSDSESVVSISVLSACSCVSTVVPDTRPDEVIIREAKIANTLEGCQAAYTTLQSRFINLPNTFVKAERFFLLTEICVKIFHIMSNSPESKTEEKLAAMQKCIDMHCAAIQIAKNCVLRVPTLHDDNAIKITIHLNYILFYIRNSDITNQDMKDGLIKLIDSIGAFVSVFNDRSTNCTFNEAVLKLKTQCAEMYRIIARKDVSMNISSMDYKAAINAYQEIFETFEKAANIEPDKRLQIHDLTCSAEILRQVMRFMKQCNIKYTSPLRVVYTVLYDTRIKIIAIWDSIKDVDEYNKPDSMSSASQGIMDAHAYQEYLQNVIKIKMISEPYATDTFCARYGVIHLLCLLSIAQLGEIKLIQVILDSDNTGVCNMYAKQKMTQVLRRLADTLDLLILDTPTLAYMWISDSENRARIAQGKNANILNKLINRKLQGAIHSKNLKKIRKLLIRRRINSRLQEVIILDRMKKYNLEMPDIKV